MSIISSLGTVVQETSNFLVQEVIISSATSSVTFSNLDIVKDGGYTLEVAGKNGNSVDTVYNMYFNNDLVNANYSAYYNGTSGGGTNVGGVVAQPYAWWAGNAQAYTAKHDIFFGASGYINNIGYMRSIYTSNNVMYMIHSGYGVLVSNVTSITLLSSVANGFGVGTILRLYRKKQGIPSAFPSAQGMMVADILVPSNTQAVDITGLNINLHGGYNIKMMIKNNSGVRALYKIFPNGDLADANWTGEVILGIGGGAAAGSAYLNWIGQLDNTYIMTANMNINHEMNRLCALTNSRMELNGGSYNTWVSGNMYTPTITNLTTLRIGSEFANGIGAGSRIRVYRNK